MIQISPEDLEALKQRLDTWAENLKSMVSESANAEANYVASLPQFVGQSANSYRQHFDELKTELNTMIENVCNEQIAQMAGRAQQIGQAFSEMDQSFGI